VTTTRRGQAEKWRGAALAPRPALDARSASASGARPAASRTAAAEPASTSTTTIQRSKDMTPGVAVH
jgi:hypothetical protein